MKKDEPIYLIVYPYWRLGVPSGDELVIITEKERETEREVGEKESKGEKESQHGFY